MSLRESNKVILKQEAKERAPSASIVGEYRPTKTSYGPLTASAYRCQSQIVKLVGIHMSISKDIISRYKGLQVRLMS